MATEASLLEEIVTAAGLPVALAEALRREEISVDVLLKSTLSERRDVLRAMGVSFGVLLTLNRVLEEYRKRQLHLASGDNDAEEEEDDEDEDNGGAGAGADDEATETGEELEAAEVRPQPWRPAELRMPANANAQLQAAAMLLRSAEVHTLRALQAYLGNVLDQPAKASYRTIMLANPLFHERVWGVPGGASTLRAAGFAESGAAGNTAALVLAYAPPFFFRTSACLAALLSARSHGDPCPTLPVRQVANYMSLLSILLCFGWP